MFSRRGALVGSASLSALLFLPRIARAAMIPATGVLQFSHPGNSRIHCSLTELLYHDDNDGMVTVHFEYDVSPKFGPNGHFLIGNASGSLGITHNIPVQQTDQGLFGTMAFWNGVKPGLGYTQLTPRCQPISGGGGLITFILNGAGKEPAFLSASNMISGAKLMLYGTVYYRY